MSVLKTVQRRQGVLLFCFIVLLAIMRASGQCGYEQNGYVFLHPYFSGVNWQSTIHQAEIIPSEELCRDKPLQIAISRLATKGTVVYSTADGLWHFMNSPLVNNDCVCCRPTVEFDSPQEVVLPASLGLQSDIPFVIMSRGATDADTVYAVIAAESRAYCLHIATVNGSIGAVDTLPGGASSSQKIVGVWREPNRSDVDTAVWLVGSAGFVQKVPFKANAWGSVQQGSIDTAETVLCVGGGFAGTASGKIYAVSGTVFTLKSSVAAAAIRSIGNGVAVGDKGTILVLQDTTWKSYSSGTTNYRYANRTGTAGGSAVELLDSSWHYSGKTLFESSTRITAVTPTAVQSGLNGGVYSFAENSVTSIKMYLHDPDDNSPLPAVVVKRNAGADTLNRSVDGIALLRNDPSVVCSTAQAYFTDTLVTVVLNSSMVTVEAQAARGSYSPSCGFWSWQQFIFKSENLWSFGDSLYVLTGGDTLRLVNKIQSTVNQLAGLSPTNNKLLFTVQNYRMSVPVISHARIRRLMLFNAAGCVVWRSSGSISVDRMVSLPQQLVPGVHLLRLEYNDGRSAVHRFAVFNH